MIRFNLHTHSRFSDGNAEPWEYIPEALNAGFSVLGFSEHSPLPFENNFSLKESDSLVYLKTIRELKNKFEGKIEILLGMEVDFIPGYSREFSHYRNTWDLDYVIGSVHLVLNDRKDGLWFIDGPSASIYDDGLNTYFEGDAKAAVTAYYQQLMRMIREEHPDIIGHLDKVKMHNKDRYFSESETWYQKLIDETLAVIEESGVVVEVNTRGIYKQRSDSLFPGNAILQRILEKGIPVTICTDAHKPAEVSSYFNEALILLQGIGFSELHYRTRGRWEKTMI